MNEPKLRFKADDGNQFPSWDEKKLGDICTPLTYGMNVAAIKYDGLNKYIRITDIDDESHLYKSDEYVSPNGVLDDRYLVGENDILFARTGASVGKSYIYNKKDGKLYYAGFLIKAHVKSENSNFVFYQTLTERYAKWVQLTSMRSGQPGINANEYSEFGIQIPCLQEQQKIASLFTELDTLIQSAEKELEGYRELKQGMLQKMFPKRNEVTPEIRFLEFDGNWEQCKLGDIGKTYTSLSGKTADDFGHGEANFITYMNVYSNSIADPTMVAPIEIDAKQHEVEVGDVFFTTSSETPDEVGMSCVLKEKQGIVYLNSFCFGFRPTKSFDLNFLAYMLRSNYVRNQIKILAQGVSRYNISKTKMMDVSIIFPDYEEQKKIGEYFSNLDNLINLQQKEIDGYKELKKGLLQQMFC